MENIRIPFPEHVNTRNFERVLSSHLAETRDREMESVSFDFTRVQWCDLFELSLIVIWIDDLVSRKKHVEFSYPLCEPFVSDDDVAKEKKVTKRKSVCSYLNRWDFDNFLRSRSVEIIGHDQKYPYWPPNAEQDSILPIRLFEGERGFNEFLSNLEDRKQYEIIFKDTLSLSVIGNGTIRDTIMREIGQNIYDHAKGRCGFLTVGTIPSLDDITRAVARYGSSTELDKPFFRALGRSGYLQIIIADRGPGIAKTLKDKYVADTATSEAEKGRPTENKVIDYAFEFDTTSKSRDKLKGKKELDEGRGLHWVKEIVHRNKGLLSVRSGATMVRYDFLTGRDKHSYKSNLDDPGLKRLARLGGTQIKILFPLNPELTERPDRERPVYTQFKLVEPIPRSSYKVLEVRSYFDSTGAWADESTDRLIGDFPKGGRARGESRIVILDFANTTWQKDELFPLLVTLSMRQHDGLAVVGTNTEQIPQIFDVASAVLSDKIRANPLKLKPVLFVRDLEFEALGMTDEDKEIVASLSSTGEPSSDGRPRAVYEDFASRNDNLFYFDPVTGRSCPTFSIQEIRSQLANYYLETLSQIILDQTNGIYYPGQYVLPSNAYVDGYFRVNTLLTYTEYYRRVLFVLLDALLALDSPPDCILTFSSDSDALGKDLAMRLREIYGRPVEHLNLEDARDKSANAGRLLVKLRSKKVAILNSVIGTAASLEAILDVCQEPNFNISVQKILSLVDARDKDKAEKGDKDFFYDRYEYKGEVHALNSILISPLKFYETKPIHWRPEDIRRIDPKTNAPDPIRPQPASEPLWQPAGEFFINNIVSNARALNIGHYARRHRHYTYFFDMLRIGNSVGPEIASNIEKDIDEFSKTIPADRTQHGGVARGEQNTSETSKGIQVTYVIYDEGSRGAEQVAGEIAVRLQSEPCSIQSFVKARNLIRADIKDQNIVIYASSVSSGSKLQYLVNQVAGHTFKPKRIFAYAVIHRRESDSVPFYQNVDVYSGVELRTRYFVELEIPAYGVWDCPACNQRQQLRDLRESCSDDTALSEFIGRKLDELSYSPVDKENELPVADEAKAIEWARQAMIRRRLGEAKTVLQARFPIKETINKYVQKSHVPAHSDEMLRLLEVIAREVVLLKTYGELFYKELRGKIAEACISLLHKPVDPLQREKYAIKVLGGLKPDSFIDNLPPILKGLAGSPSLLPYLFVELLLLIKESGESEGGGNRIKRIAEALDLCQKAIEEDSIFTHLSVRRVTEIQRFVNYVRRRLRIDTYRKVASQQSWETAVAKLWRAFVHSPEQTHPKLIQGFSHISNIVSVKSFRDIYKSAYVGEGNFAQTAEEVIPLFDILANLLSSSVRNDLNYFLFSGKGTFSGDFKLLDDGLRALATLDSQHRLTDEAMDAIFWKNQEVGAAKRRLNQYAFQESTSLIRKALEERFSDLSSAVNEVVKTWEERFRQMGVDIQSSPPGSEVFAPLGVLKDVLDNFFKNIYMHAFVEEVVTKVVKVAVDHRLHHVVIRICDTGRGILLEDRERRPDGGISRSEKIVDLYRGKVQLMNGEQGGMPEFSTVVEISLYSKEAILS